MYEYAIRELKIIRDYIVDIHNNNKMPESTRLRVRDFENAIRLLDSANKIDSGISRVDVERIKYIEKIKTVDELLNFILKYVIEPVIYENPDDAQVQYHMRLFNKTEEILAELRESEEEKNE